MTRYTKSNKGYFQYVEHHYDGKLIAIGMGSLMGLGLVVYRID